MVVIAVDFAVSSDVSGERADDCLHIKQLEVAGYSRTTLRTLRLVLGKALGEQTGLTLGACKPRESDDLRAVWTVDEVRVFHRPWA